MIVRNLADVSDTVADVSGAGWRSRRLLVADDRMGFSLHDTIVAAGADLELAYRHHLEACYCVSGSAEITDLATGTEHHIAPGTVYALDQHDRHRLTTRTGLHLVCVFNPALRGGETHDDSGSFPAPGG